MKSNLDLPSTLRRNIQGVAIPEKIGNCLNQGSNGTHSSASTIPEILAQGGNDKRGNPGTPNVRKFLGQ
jgi:hypothetical protein